MEYTKKKNHTKNNENERWNAYTQKCVHILTLPRFRSRLHSTIIKGLQTKREQCKQI